MEKVQAGLRRSQLKMQVCGALGLLEPGTERGGTTRREEKCRSKGWGFYKGLPKRCRRKSCRQGAPLIQKAFSLLRLPGAPRVWRRAVERSGGQSWLGQPFQLLVLLQFPHPAERQRGVRGECWIRKGGRAEIQ